MKRQLTLAFMLCTLCFQLSFAGPEQAPMSVWVNEAVVATYSYNYKNYLEEQKQIAKYFTMQGWKDYTKALTDSKLPETVQKNLYYISAVATQPPVITQIDPTHWKANMELLVMYQNPQFQQRQNLKVTVEFTTAPSGQGVRGFSITKLQSVVNKAPCECPVSPPA